MKAKTTKFLAVLAVLAMAFAAFAVFAPSENDAADEDSKWIVPTGADAGKPSYITLGTDVIKPADGDTLVDATAYYVDTDMTLNIDKNADLTNGAILIFLKEGVTLDVIRPAGCQKVVVYSLFGVVESTDKVTGATILTLHDNYGAEDSKLDVVNHTKWVSTSNTLQFPKTWANSTGDSVTGYDKTYHGTDSRSHNTFYEGWDLEGKNRMLWRTPQDVTVNVEGATMNVHGDFLSLEYYGPMADPSTADSSVWTFQEATGTIGSVRTYDANAKAFIASANTATLDNFTGVIEMARVASSTGTAADEIPVITKWISGDITVTKGSIVLGEVLGEKVNIPAGSKITYAQGATILSGQSFSFQGVMDDNYATTETDIYKFTNNGSAITAGVGGFIVSPGSNGFELRGNVDMADKNGWITWSFQGPAFFTGAIDSKGTVRINADWKNYDFTFGSATIYTTGLYLTDGAAVETGAVLTVDSGMTLEKKSLKVGENAYVRVYGDMTIYATEASEAAAATGAKVYTAGNIVADSVKLAATTGSGDQATTTTKPVDSTTNLSGIVYYYKDGSLTGSNVEFTLVDEARMAYVHLTGRGDLGVNGVTVITNHSKYYEGEYSGYYNYSGMVFYPVATQDVLNLAAESRIVGGINAVADFSESDVNIALWYAKYKINYETATPIFVIEYKETYEVIVNGAGTDYTITDSNGTQVYTYVDGENTKAKLIFGETYSLNGMVSTSKYTYTSSLNSYVPDVTEDIIVQPLNYISTTLTTFEMIRAAQTITVNVGEEQTITVKYNDQVLADKALVAGDKVLDYSVDGGVTVTPVFLELTDNGLVGIFKVFNTDTVLVKFAEAKYFTHGAPSELVKIAGGLPSAALQKKGWEYTFTGEPNAVTGGCTITYSLDVKNDKYVLVDEATPLVGNLQVTVTFQDYYMGSHKHDKQYIFTPSSTAATLNVDTYKGETYTMTWTDLTDVREVMTYGEKKEVYEEGAVVSIGASETTYTLTLSKIYYASVQNKATKDFTVSDGMGNTAPVAVDVTAPKAVEITKKHVPVSDTVQTAYDEYTVTLTLEVTGAYIRSWSYAIYADSTSTTPLYEGGTYSLPTADLYYKDQDITGKVIRITNLEVIPILYLVKTQPDEHAKIAGDYSRAGYYGDKMFVYVNVEAGFSVTGVEVFYEDPEHEGFPGDKYTDAQKDSSPDQGDFWYYMMPASNVVLIPTTTSDYATVTFKNYDGTVLQGPTKVLKGTTPEYTGDIPTKPATETETYRFAGWEPVLAPVTEDTTYVAQFETVAPTSTDVTIFLEKSTNGVKVTLLANDGRFIQDGSIEFTYYYAYELNGKWATGFKTFTAQTGEIDDKSLFQFTVDLSEQERFAETMWIEGTYTSADEVVNAASELIVYQ